MAESSRRYNLRNTRKKPQGVLLELWEVEYSKVISNKNRRIPSEKVKTAIRSAFEDGMFEQWRITLKCPLSGHRIRVPGRYADCTHIECFDLEAFLRMKTQKNIRVCPICQKEIEKPLTNLRIDRYIETVLSTMPDSMQVELLPDGSFTEVHEKFVVEPNVISDEEPFVQDNNALSLEIKQEISEENVECTMLSDGEDEPMEEIAIIDIKSISLMPLNMDIKPNIAPSSEPEQTQCGEHQEIQEAIEDDHECITLSDGEEEIDEMKPISLMPLNMDIKPKIVSSSEREHIHSGEDQVIQEQPNLTANGGARSAAVHANRFLAGCGAEGATIPLVQQYPRLDRQNLALQKTNQSRKKGITLGNALECSVGDAKKRRSPLKGKQSARPSADVNAHTDLSSSETNLSSDSSRDENDESQTMINENDHRRNFTMSMKDVLNVPNYSAQKMKITTVVIDIYYGTAFFITSEGQEYDGRPLYEYVSILRKSEADVLGCQAHIGFKAPHVGIWSKAGFRSKNVIGSQKKFEQFSEDVHSISHLWKNGRISVELYKCSDNAIPYLSPYGFCDALFGQKRSILNCRVLEINWFNEWWPFFVITNVVHQCKRLIFHQQKRHQSQKLHLTFLDIIYTMTLPQHVDVTLELDKDTYYFIYELERRFQGSDAQYFKFKLVFPGFLRNKLLWNDYGTLEMKIVASQRDDNGLRRDSVIIEQCPHTSVFDQQPS
ncbi:MIZ/SP-RING zinc finger domain-containing protein [Ditylenchus destructor]|uniref:MIZ/SP-RING zinc finger domain-containing protein n=1 Tax=Ditylenchus destructor TaxID=166010 RepID=A0AAD4MPY4_9BILA|nr:MIZ/SP-RING zinc finger domain-containing protein [Ditylenchus destructor]